jgi:tRNA threonylcarbamoyl adenosine modification protein YjeE
MNAPQKTWDLVLANEAATRDLGREIASALVPGDVVALGGGLGVGKSALARAIIQTLAGDETLEVPSPTFTLMQVYELPRLPIVHADLYRVNTLAELSELGWEEASIDAAVVVEWPERAGPLLQAERLEIHLELAPDLGPTHRRAQLTGIGGWAERIARLRSEHAVFEAAGFAHARREHLQGDASTRSYERLHLGNESAILMKVPPSKDGPAIRNGKSYGEIAKLAQDMRPFIAISRGLRARGFSAPEIYSADMHNNLLIIEDLGTEGVVAGEPPAPVEERYAAAIDLLAALHKLDLPPKLSIAPRIDYEIPRYDLDAMLIEADLLVDWYVPYSKKGAQVASAMREAFRALWREALLEPLSLPPSWVLRDYHSPNLLWLPAREGIKRVGLLDIQDALIGPRAYDVASLLMDARVTVSEDLEMKLLARYATGMSTTDPSFDPGRFATQYVAMGAQRATKILGIFARLDQRDGKPQYLVHMPRVWNYLMRALEHPSLTALKEWYAANLAPPPNMEMPIPRDEQELLEYLEAQIAKHTPPA